MDKNSTLPHQLVHHSKMLSDKVRLQAFRKALHEVIRDHHCVVDIGTGTGILASYAAKFTNHKVYALEYFKPSADFAKKSTSQSRDCNIEVVNKSSYGKPIKANPNVVVTETIGAIGPEENIVELCYEFKKRYPTIEKFVPSVLSVYAVPVKSKLIRRKKEEFTSPFEMNQSDKLDFSWALPEIESQYCGQLLGADLCDAKWITKEVELATYNLGETLQSGFVRQLTEGIYRCDGVHLFFDAKLSERVNLSSSSKAPKTHWLHRYACKPEGACRFTIQYNKSKQIIEFQWVH